MSDFLNEIKKHFEEKDVSKIINIYEKLNDYYSTDGLLTVEFGRTIALKIVNNRLDADSVIIGLMYPIFKENPTIINLEFINSDIRNIFERLEKVENLNLSTHQEQLENIKKMFIALEF